MMVSLIYQIVYNIFFSPQFQQLILKYIYIYSLIQHRIENGNGECDKDTTDQQKTRKQHKSAKGSSTQREKLAGFRKFLFKHVY